MISDTTGTRQGSYIYDGDGLRQSKTIADTQGTTTTAETWDTTGALPTLLQEGSTRYVTGPDGLPLEQIDGQGTVLFYYQDQLGSTRALLMGAATRRPRTATMPSGT